MRIVNLTHSPFWFPYHFDFLCGQTGHTGETFCQSIFGSSDASTADEMWRIHSEYFNSFDAAFVSHASSWSRVFLRGEWTKPLYVWFNYKFDHAVSDCNWYYDQIRAAGSNAKFFAATEQDRLYALGKLGSEFPLGIVPPFHCVENESKFPIPCDPRSFFLVGKHNESLIRPMLANLNVPFYQHNWESAPPDLRGIKGIVHIPYVGETRSFWENMALNNIYFLPTENFVRELRERFKGPTGYFWDNYIEYDVDKWEGDFSHTEWYRDGNRKFFVYFSSFKELLNDFTEEIKIKKQSLADYNRVYEKETREKWLAIIGEGNENKGVHYRHNRTRWLPSR